MVVRIEQVVSQVPPVSFQRSQSPANANSAPSLTSKQNGCFDFPLRFQEPIGEDQNGTVLSFFAGLVQKALEFLNAGIRAARAA